MSRFIPVDRQTDYLLPPLVDEWLPDGHLARFVVDVVEQLDLSALTQRAESADKEDAADGMDIPAEMAHRLKTQAGRALFALRKHTVELVFGIIKHVMGFRQFSLRGLESVSGEWRLATMEWNIRRMHRLASG